MWKLLINKAKLEWHVYLSVTDTFPSPNHAKEVVITPIVQQIFQEFKRKVPSLYDFTLPRKLKERDSVKWLKMRADELGIWQPVKEFCTINKGIECNFARAALYRPCAKDAVPPGTVALISTGIKCVLHAISKHGNIQDLGKLYESVQAQEYEYFHDMIGKVLEDRKGGYIFEDQLEKWARKTRCGLERVLKQSGDDNEYALAPM
ncbi:hypothetical protein L210DRAFT_3500269 [Boletus edulis BED1]|uniref:Uncharacterized protein n=1 Tax=Boletus edulis BED1 TaxID=1328754 RepID=A0AAD4GLL1_BOLED|nr:hypothetical protein L210DRAFT_3500269 [Boletus edulis BED1]